MNRTTTTWDIEKVRQTFAEVEFPEYQREPNIWNRDDKQSLIDSILRHFDIASIYLYQRLDGALECIDGRQRLNAIMAFLGLNETDEKDNGFPIRNRNEIVEEIDNELAPLQGLTFDDLGRIAGDNSNDQAQIAREAIKRVMGYQLTVILLADAKRPEEFNLQFLRLNLGMLINAGEKLHAMVGGMRNLLFGERGLGRHKFLELVDIPTRRYAREIVATQIMCQAFSYQHEGRYTKTRHYDLQRFVKQHGEVAPDNEIVEQIRRTLDALLGGLSDEAGLLRNRAMTVSVVLLAWRERLYEDDAEVGEFVAFLRAFSCRLRWQVRNLSKNLKIDEQYRYLMEFQRNITQAAVERPAVERRHDVLESEWHRWRKTKEIRGDREYLDATARDANEACEEAV